MQKKIIALAVAGLMSGAAFAQTNVTISGLFDAGVANTKLEGNSASNNAAYNGSGTSQITFAATEDLGGGMKAGALLETDVRGAGSMANFQHYVWVGGNFGTISLGQRTNFSTTTAVTMQPFGTAPGGGYSTNFVRLRGGGFGAGGAFSSATAANMPNSPTTDTRSVRANGVIDYRSPSFSGFTVGLQYMPTNNDATETAVSRGETNLGLNYNMGPLNVSYAYDKISNTGNVVSGEADVKHNLLGANYNMGPATIYFGYTTSKADNGAGVTTTNSRSWNVALKYAVTGNIDIMANILRDNDKLAANQDSTQNAIGADYKFSKRTAAYARYVNGDYDKSSATGNGLGKFRLMSVGLRHAF